MLGGTYLTIGFLPRLSGRHENDLGQPESSGDLTRCHKVAFIVDPGNVERPRDKGAQLLLSPTSIDVVVRW